MYLVNSGRQFRNGFPYGIAGYHRGGRRYGYERSCRRSTNGCTDGICSLTRNMGNRAAEQGITRGAYRAYYQTLEYGKYLSSHTNKRLQTSNTHSPHDGRDRGTPTK